MVQAEFLLVLMALPKKTLHKDLQIVIRSIDLIVH